MLALWVDLRSTAVFQFRTLGATCHGPIWPCHSMSLSSTQEEQVRCQMSFYEYTDLKAHSSLLNKATLTKGLKEFSHFRMIPTGGLCLMAGGKTRNLKINNRLHITTSASLLKSQIQFQNMQKPVMNHQTPSAQLLLNIQGWIVGAQRVKCLPYKYKDENRHPGPMSSGWVWKPTY